MTFTVTYSDPTHSPTTLRRDNKITDVDDHMNDADSLEIVSDPYRDLLLLDKWDDHSEFLNIVYMT